MKLVQTVTNGDWSVSSTSGGDIKGVQFHPHRTLGGDWKKQLKPECHGKVFPTTEACSDYALQHGFTRVYHSRPDGFIHLRLSPATRRHLSKLTGATLRTELFKVLCLRPGDKTYVKAVLSASHFEGRRRSWLHYLQTGQTPELDPRNQPVKVWRKL